MELRNLIGRPVAEADTPALLVDIGALQANIDRMAAFFETSPAA